MTYNKTLSLILIEFRLNFGFVFEFGL